MHAALVADRGNHLADSNANHNAGNPGRAFEKPGSVDLAEGDDLALAWVLFAVVVGVWVTALAYAAYCRSQGGWPDIRFGWGGFRVSCNK